MFDFSLLKSEGEYLLVNTDDWFFAPDGQQYKAVWGRARIFEAKEMFGFRPTGDANWYLQVGSEDCVSPIFIAGCRIHYAFVCPNPPKGKEIYILD